jgi:nucleolar complex protein 2
MACLKLPVLPPPARPELPACKPARTFSCQPRKKVSEISSRKTPQYNANPRSCQAMAKTKATKKFEKNRLGDVIKTRKSFAKIKQKHQINDKKKARRARENAEEAAEEPALPAKSDPSAQFEHMTVDEFFTGGFEIPEDPSKRSKKSKVVTGKRKRTGDEEEAAGGDSSSESIEENPIVGGSDSEAESEDGLDKHKDDIEALKTKDPEFYKYLQENDAELLDFEDGDFKEVDALSDEEKPKKKRKKAKGRDEEESDADSVQERDNEVTKAMTAKWEIALKENKSLRSMKEVILAFRAAAHLNEEDGKSYKYSVSSSEGIPISNLAVVQRADNH